MGQRLALLIGTSEYDDNKYHRLQAPEADVKKLAEVLGSRNVGGFSIQPLLINRPTSEIKSAIDAFFKRVKGPDDLLLLYLSCHGDLTTESELLHFVCKDTDNKRLMPTSIPASDLITAINEYKPKQLVVILDCCYSGAIAKGKEEIGKDIASFYQDRVQGRGRVILTSSNATEKSFQNQSTGLSVFTSHLVEGLETGQADTDMDGEISTDEVYDYIHHKMQQEAHVQTPVKWIPKEQVGKIVIAKNRHIVSAPQHSPQAIKLQDEGGFVLAPDRGSLEHDGNGKEKSDVQVREPSQRKSLSEKEILMRRRLLLAVGVGMGVIISGGVGGIIYASIAGHSQSTPVKSQPTMPPSTTIKIGTEMPTSGDDAGNGQPIQNAVTMAIDDAMHANVISGYTLLPDNKDDTGANNVQDPSKGASNLRSLVQDALVVGVIGPIDSSGAEKEIPVAASAPIALISPSSTYPCLTKYNANNCTLYTPADLRGNNQITYFRIATLDTIQGVAAANYLYSLKNPLFRRVCVISSQQSHYSQGLSQYFKQVWGNKPGTQLMDDISLLETSTQDEYLAAMQENFKYLVPDFIYFSGNTPGATNAWQAMRSMPKLSNTAFAGGDGIVDAGFNATVAPKLQASDPPIYATIAAQGSKTTDFKTKYQGRFPTQPYTPYAASGYDAATILIQAVKQTIDRGIPMPSGSQDTKGAKKFRQAVIDEIKKIQYDGVTGHQTFDSDGDTANKAVSVYYLSPQTRDWEFITNV